MVSFTNKYVFWISIYGSCLRCPHNWKNNSSPTLRTKTFNFFNVNTSYHAYYCNKSLFFMSSTGLPHLKCRFLFILDNATLVQLSQTSTLFDHHNHALFSIYSFFIIPVEKLCSTYSPRYRRPHLVFISLLLVNVSTFTNTRLQQVNHSFRGRTLCKPHCIFKASPGQSHIHKILQWWIDFALGFKKVLKKSSTNKE